MAALPMSSSPQPGHRPESLLQVPIEEGKPDAHQFASRTRQNSVRARGPICLPSEARKSAFLQDSGAGGTWLSQSRGGGGGGVLAPRGTHRTCKKPDRSSSGVSESQRPAWVSVRLSRQGSWTTERKERPEWKPGAKEKPGAEAVLSHGWRKEGERVRRRDGEETLETGAESECLRGWGRGLRRAGDSEGSGEMAETQTEPAGQDVAVRR